MAKNKTIPECKYAPGQVIGKVEVYVDDIAYDGGWHITLGIGGSYELDCAIYDEGTIEDIIAEMVPANMLKKLKNQAEKLAEKIKELEQELNV
jgi:hypothetical protein